MPHNPGLFTALAGLVFAAVASASTSTFARIPLIFEQNRGQTDGRVEFLSRGDGYSLFLTGGDAVLRLKNSVVRMKLVGAHRGAPASGLDQLPGRSNYFFDGDPKKWRTNVAQFSKVRYAGIYRGIDVVYYGNQRQLEYDFVVAPGADPSQIRLEFDGASKTHVDEAGDLIVSTSGGDLRFHKPVVYQRSGSERLEVAGRFRTSGSRVGFEVGKYRRDLPLVIDPVLSYSTYLGGSAPDGIAAMAVDSAGNVYVAGTTMSTDFPTTTGAMDISLAGNQDIFISKVNAAGSALLYSTFLGGADTDSVFDLGIDSTGSAYVLGSGSMQSTAGAYSSAVSPGYLFIAKINASGSLGYLTGTGLNYFSLIPYGTAPGRLAVSRDGSVYVTGAAAGYFTTTVGAFRRTASGGSDIGVLRINATGMGAIYATYLATGWVSDVEVDALGNLYLVGTSDSIDFPTTSGALYPASAQSAGGFVAKLNANGSALEYATMLRGAQPTAIAITTGGEATVVGNANSAFETTADAYLPIAGNSGASFLARLNSSGSAYRFATCLESYYYPDYLRLQVAVDAAGNSFVTSPINGPTTQNAFQPNPGGSGDAYVAKFNVIGSVLLYATYLGGSGYDSAAALALDGSGNLYIAGTTQSTNFPTTSGAYSTTNKGGNDGFIAKIDNTNVSCSYTLTSTTAAYTAGLSTGTVGVTANSGCVWVATVDAQSSWIRVTSGGSALGSGTVSYEVQANNSTQARTGNITIAGQQFTVTQAGASCTYSIAPQSLAFDNEGGISNVAVTSPQGCTWTSLSNATWVTINTGQQGYGNGTVRYTVAPNGGGTRTGTMTIAGQTFTVTQGASGPACTYTLSSTAQSAPAQGATYTVTVSSGAGCTWSATSNASWISVSTAGTTVSVIVSPNTGTARVGTVTIGGQAFTVSQASASACSFTLSSTSFSAPSSGGTYTVTVSTTQACPWTASSNASWITANVSANVIQLVVAPNTGGSRTGTVTVGGQTVTITQAMAGCTFGFALSAVVAPSAGLRGTVALTTSNSLCAWTASSNMPWLQVSPLDGIGTATLFYTVYPNYTTAARNATITVAGQTFAVTQVPAAGNSNERFVGQMYFAFFGRVPSAAEVTFHVGTLNAGKSRAELVNAFFNSAEFNLAGRFVAGLYVGLLNRDAEYGGWLFQRNALATGQVGPNQLVQNFITTPEYTLKFGTPSDSEFVKLLYRYVLLREPSQGEVDFQAGALTSGTTRVQLATNFLNSAEFRNGTGPRLTAFLLHALLLQRDATSTEFSSRVAAIQAGTPVQTLIEEILATAEFSSLLS